MNDNPSQYADIAAVVVLGRCFGVAITGFPFYRRLDDWLAVRHGVGTGTIIL